MKGKIMKLSEITEKQHAQLNELSEFFAYNAFVLFEHKGMADESTLALLVIDDIDIESLTMLIEMILDTQVKSYHYPDLTSAAHLLRGREWIQFESKYVALNEELIKLFEPLLTFSVKVVNKVQSRLGKKV